MDGRLEMGARRRPWRRAVCTGAAALLLTAPAVGAAADQGQSVHDSQWALKAANASKAWTVTKGAGVTVAVVDSGVDASHPDLRGQVTGGGDLTNGASVGGTQDVVSPLGHGTEVASLIAGTGRNYHGHGLLGLAPQARILSFGTYQDGAPVPSATAAAVRAALRRGAQVIVVPSGTVRVDPALRSVVRDAVRRDVVVVSGVGDTTTSTRPTYPAAERGVVATAAVDRQGRALPAPGGPDRVTIAAPGVDVLAASSDGRYWTGTSTSLAAAWVAGAAALVRSAHPDWTAGQTIRQLIGTARTGGCSGNCGYGLVDPTRALTTTKAPSATTNPLLAPQSAGKSATAKAPATSTGLGLLPWFIGISLAVVVLYVAIMVVLVRRRRDRGDRPAGEQRGRRHHGKAA